METSRRKFLGTLGLGAAAAVAAPAVLERLASGEPSRAAVAGGPILLDSNENAYGPFPSVASAARDALHVGNRYPFREQHQLQEAVAAYHKISRNQVLLGNGSTEMLRVSPCAFCGPSRKVVVAEPTFESIADYAERMRAEVVKVPLLPNFAHDLDAMLAKANGAGLVYICNPNNPTASLTPRRDIEAFLGKLPKETYVLIDEAYHHFAASPEYASFIEHPVDDPRVIIARTFSKIYGMAGLRLGYAVAQPKTIERLKPYQLEDNINMIAARCALAGLNDEAGMQAAQQQILADRAEFMRQANNRKLRVIPSYANFLMMETGRPVRTLIAHFNSQNIRVGRPFARMENYLRVSLGRPEEMTAFWRAWDMLPART